MLRINISKAGEPSRTNTFDKREITVGRTPANDVVIPEPGVSSCHARILYVDGELTLIDLESTNGTFVNGERIRGPQMVGPNDEVYICAHKLEFALDDAPAASPGSASAPGPGLHADPAPPSVVAQPPPVSGEPPSVAPPPPLGPSPAQAGPVGGPAPLGAEPPPVAPPPPPGPPSPPRSQVPSQVGPSPVRAKAPDEPPTLPPLIGPSAEPSSAEPPVPPEPPPPPAPAPSPAPQAAGPPSPAGSGGTIRPKESASPPPAPIPAPTPAPIGAAPPAPPSPPPSSPLQPEPPSPTPSGSSDMSVHAPPPEPVTPQPSDSSPPSAIPEAAPQPPPQPPPPGDNGSPGPSAWSLPQGVSDAPSAPIAVAEATPVPPRSRDSTPPGQGFARPVAVSPRISSAPIVVSTASSGDDLGSLEDLAHLPGDEQVREACARVFAVAFDRLWTGGHPPARTEDSEQRATELVQRLLSGAASRYDVVDVDFWRSRLVDELLGLGKLGAHLQRDDIREVFIHGPERALVRTASNAPQPVDIQFSCPQAIEAVVRRLTGTWFSVEQPVVDARTFDGAEVYAVHDTVATGGPVVTIRLTGDGEPVHSLEQLLQQRAMPPSVANLLSACVQGGLNIAICAGPGAQSFPVLAALAEAAPAHHRQLVVRLTHEPGLLPAGVVVLEGEGLVGTEGITVMQALVRTALGLSPDRLLVHEVAGPEAQDVLSAMGRGLRGTILTMRAGSAYEGLRRLATLVGLAGAGADAATRAIHVAQSVELIVVVSRFPDGQTRLTSVAEPVLSPAGDAQVVELMSIDPQTRNWTHTGATPSFAAELQRRGIQVDLGTA